MLSDMFQQSGQAESAKVLEIGGQTKTTQTDTVGTSSDPSPIQSIPPHPRGMTFRLIMIFQAIQSEAMTRLGTLEAKVHNMEGGIKPWVDEQMARQNYQVQQRLDVFESSITRQMGNWKTHHIAEIKDAVTEIKVRWSWSCMIDR